MPFSCLGRCIRTKAQAHVVFAAVLTAQSGVQFIAEWWIVAGRGKQRATDRQAEGCGNCHVVADVT